jgi:hypothetical protein
LTRANNGAGRPWIIERRDSFVADAERLIADHPRLADVLAAVEDQFASIPTYRAAAVGASEWLYATNGAADAPSLVLFYEINEATRVVALIGAELNG